MGKDLFFGFKEQSSHSGQTLFEAIGKRPKLILSPRLVGLLKDAPNGRQHHTLPVFGHEREKVPKEMHPATLPACPQEDFIDGPPETLMGV